MIYVYILQSLKDNGYYIGICKEPQKRVEKHNTGGVSSTRNRRPFKVIYVEKYETYALARLREKEIKSYKGGNKFRDLIS